MERHHLGDTPPKTSDDLQQEVHAPANAFVLRPFYWIIPIIFWSLLVAASFQYYSKQTNLFAEEAAVNKARFIFQMIEDMRLWNARHGGVYVRETETTPSNPYLKTKDKDIVTLKGTNFTQINPAYMTRQIAALMREQSQILINITSLNPLNPSNVADEWERGSLNFFEEGYQENYSFLNITDVHLFRYMAPLITTKPCLTCHEHQGYKVGDVRGGISVSFDSTPFLITANQQIQTQITIHGIAWLLLCSLTILALSRLRVQMMTLKTLNQQQEKIVTLRTQNLRNEAQKRQEAEAQFHRFIDATAEGIVALDFNARCTFANPQAANLLGFDGAEKFIGKSFHKISGHQTNKNNCPITLPLENGKSLHSDQDFFTRLDGTVFPVEYTASPVFQNVKIIGSIVTFTDITERRAKENELQKLSIAVEQSPATTMITNAKGKIEYVNKRFSEVSGYPKEEIIGKNPRFLKSGQTPYEVYKHMWDTISAGDEWKGEMLNRKKDGSLFWEEALISPIKDSLGKVTHFVAVKRDITEHKQEMDEVWRQANYDVLTNLPNRNLFEDRLENAVALAEREGRKLALLFIDLDGFKNVNDTYGHETGDLLLKATAERLQSHLRHSDTAARIGGDEFVIILQDSQSIEAVENVARKILDEVSKELVIQDHKVQVTASVGICVMPRDCTTSNDLLRFSDIAMYGAKQKGKNQFCHYDAFIVCTPGEISES